MKKLLLYVSILAAGLFVASCSEDSLSEKSVITDSVNAETEFDRWLEANYRAPFNIRFLYRYEDIETDMDYDLVPADELYCRILAKMVRYLWLDPYTEVTNAHFMRANSPRMMQVIGCGAYDFGQIKLGTAEGGQKITLYVANWMENFLTINRPDATNPDYYTVHIDNVERVNFYYMHTIHHEFAHILNQKIDFPREFNTISLGGYSGSWTGKTDQWAAENGFVSPYASSAATEDFVEVYSYYLSRSDEEWAAWLEMAGAEGADKITRKLQIVKDYMADSWGLDVEEMRASLARRYAEIEDIDWSNFNTEQ